MTITYDVEPRLAARVAAVVQIDGTARPQVPRSGDNLTRGAADVLAIGRFVVRSKDVQ